MKAVPGEADEDETEATATIVSKKAQEKAMAAVTHERSMISRWTGPLSERLMTCTNPFLHIVKHAFLVPCARLSPD
jgi:hypothetical protein